MMKGPKLKEQRGGGAAHGNGSQQCNFWEPKPQDFIGRKIKSITWHALNLSAAAKCEKWQVASGKRKVAKWQQQKPQHIAPSLTWQDCQRRVFQGFPKTFPKHPPPHFPSCNLQSVVFGLTRIVNSTY